MVLSQAERKFCVFIARPLSIRLTELLIGTFEFPAVLHQLLTNISTSSVSEIHGAAINRPECLHSHSHRGSDVLLGLPRLLRRDPRVTVHAVIGEIIFIRDRLNVDIRVPVPSDAISTRFVVDHRPWHSRGTLLCKFSIHLIVLLWHTRKI